MRLLIVHNWYKRYGGEDRVFESESNLLEANGQHVTKYVLDNESVDGMGRAALARVTIWNQRTYRELRALIRENRPDVAHFHNTFPLGSPALYYAARAEGVAVVQTLHNYRLLCPNALMFRDGHVCRDCVGKAIPWPGVVHACYRGSRQASGATAAMLATHRALGTWKKAVDVYITLSEFARKEFIHGGLPAEKIVVKPNFVQLDPGVGKGDGGYVLFVGRLSHEKGISTLLEASKRLGPEYPLKIVGTGPEAPEVKEFVGRYPWVEYLGTQNKAQVFAMMKDAQAMVFPSLWYEGCPLVIAESYATGLPVIASDLGVMSSVVQHGSTGLHFRPGDPGDLAAKIRWALTHPSELERMRRAARIKYEGNYAAQKNFEALMEVYRMAVGHVRVRP
jgi:glycosyltransferase involved in cell wall biosynthesis